jgi:hypothetical protein
MGPLGLPELLIILVVVAVAIGLGFLLTRRVGDSQRKIVGAVLLVAGIGFLLYGLDRLNSGGSRHADTVSQGELFGTLVLASLGFGVIALIIGIVLLASKARTPDSVRTRVKRYYE